MSHCNDAVAVVVSKRPVGVDIENINHTFPPNFANKILTKNEISLYKLKSDKEKNEFLMKSWCAKESIFKSSDDEVFNPSKIEINSNTTVGIITVNNSDLCYAVCCNNPNNIKIFSDENLLI